MRFQNPAGLWLLLGIPVLIAIWLIRPQHENRRVSSSYIWRLSDRFMKRRLPLSFLERWLVFVLQLLLVTGGAFLAARPVLSGGSRADYLVILDASASMRTVTESGLTRYDAAVDRILALAKETGRGSTVTVVTAGEEAKTVVSESSSRKEISDALAASPCGWGSSSLSGAMTLAQLFRFGHPDAEVIVYTDQMVEEADGVTVISLDGGEWNASLTGLSASRDGEGGCVLEADLTSWGRDAVIPAGVSADGRLLDAANVECPADTPVKVRFTVPGADEIGWAALTVDPGDAFEADNRLAYFPERDRPCDTLLVSETPYYFESALTALDRGRLRVSPTPVSGEFDLILYDGTVPEEVPAAGAVLYVNPDRMPEGIAETGVSEEAAGLAASAADSGMKDRLLRYMKLDGISAARHILAEASDEWVTVCSAGSDPVLLARMKEDGTTEAVLLFDPHDSNLPLTTDFVYLMRNLMNMAVPSLLERRLTEVGELQRVTLLPNTDAVSVTDPEGNVTVFEEEGEHTLTVALPGVYTVGSGGEETGFFASVPKEESSPQTVSALSLIPAEDGEETEGQTAEAGMWRIAAAVLLLLLLTEWGIWIYEQY